MAEKTGDRAISPTMARPRPGVTEDSVVSNPTRRRTAALLLLLLVVLFLLVRLRVDTRLLYLQGPGLFVLDAGFLQRFLDDPGDPARYVTLFLQELYSFPILGALVASGLAVLIGVLTRGLYLRTTPERGGFLFTLFALTATLIPALLALVGFNRYESADLVGVLLALAMALLYPRPGSRKRPTAS